MKSRDGKFITSRSRYGTFRVRFYCEENKRQEKWVKTVTDRDALIRAVKKREDLDYWYPKRAQEKPGYSVGTFEALSEEWLNHAECVREISESCLINYRSHLRNHILKVIGKTPAQNLDIKSIEQVATVLKQTKPKSRSYVSVRRNRVDEEMCEDDEFLSMPYRREILIVACMIAKFGFDRGYLPTHPFSEYKLPECPEQPYDYWRLEEEDRFLQWLEDGGVFYKRVAKSGSVQRGKPEYFDRVFKMRPGKADELFDIILFALRSGLRKGEIGALRSCDINFANNLIVVRRSWSEKERRMKNTTKSKTFRRIEMNQDMVDILKKRIMRVNSDEDLLFNIRSWAVKNFSKYCVKAGVREIHFHSLRHTCLTNLANGYGLDKPLPLPQVQVIAGHREISTTMRYVHTNGIENTTSRQFSREQRRAMQNQPAEADVSSVKHLKVILGGAGT